MAGAQWEALEIVYDNFKDSGKREVMGGFFPLWPIDIKCWHHNVSKRCQWRFVSKEGS